MSIIKGLREELQNLERADPDNLERFCKEYENKPEKRRCRSRPRTDLMVKGCRTIKGYEEKGLIPRAMERSCPQLTDSETTELSFQRYLDIGYQYGWWYQGRMHWEWIAEVENEPKEFQGTVCDLLRTQARRKLGVFYSDHVEGDCKQRSEHIAKVFQHFGEKPHTRYEILVLPNSLPEGGLLDAQVLLFDFTHEKAESVKGQHGKLREIDSGT